ncbi:subtilisin-like protein [Lojkania enalia]|uniref:Subtilisin-like protein n=1 Tax=Lojkania enalia TaxID=147567 RepID=A0A9P4NBX1_9PLEO|nr:subtilisin-like protein [Didymosphaeria enalia]
MKVSSHCTEALNAMDEISQVAESVEISAMVTQDTAPWGLQRISSSTTVSGSPRGQDFAYTFDDTNLGEGVDVYVIDTGVRATHDVFSNGGRVALGFSAFAGADASDEAGHGTHVAGTTGGLIFGVAQKTNIISVRVLDAQGRGNTTDTIAGLNYVVDQHTRRKNQPGFKGSVINMSLGMGGLAPSFDEIMRSVSEEGIHIAVAAGNDAVDACGSSPASQGGANSAIVSVGALTIDDTISEFSNIGECVDIFAPGSQILSSWPAADNTLNFLSGTSMASPHVAGVMAYLLAQDSTGALVNDPAALKAKLLDMALSDKVEGNTQGAANLLLSNGADGSQQRLVKNWVIPDVGGDWASKRWQVHSYESPVVY